MRYHQKSFGIWRVTEAILGKKNVFFLKHILEKIHNKSHSEKLKISPKICLYVPEEQP